MSDERSHNRIYDKLLWDYIETCESIRLAKTREFVREFHRLSDPEYLSMLTHRYVISGMARDIINGLASSIGAQIANGISLTPFNPRKVICGLRNYNYANNEDEALSIVDPVESTATGEYFFGDFIASICSVKKHSDYVITAYSAFEYAYDAYLKNSSTVFDTLPQSQRYTFLGVKALNREDIDPYMRMIFLIFALLVDQPSDFDQFYAYYLDSIWDYHHERTGSFLAETGLMTTEDLAEALRDERIFEICPALAQPSTKNAVTYFHEHAYQISDQLMNDQLGEALYLV